MKIKLAVLAYILLISTMLAVPAVCAIRHVASWDNYKELSQIDAYHATAFVLTIDGEQYVVVQSLNGIAVCKK